MLALKPWQTPFRTLHDPFAHMRVPPCAQPSTDLSATHCWVKGSRQGLPVTITGWVVGVGRGRGTGCGMGVGTTTTCDSLRVVLPAMLCLLLALSSIRL